MRTYQFILYDHHRKSYRISKSLIAFQIAQFAFTFDGWSFEHGILVKVAIIPARFNIMKEYGVAFHIVTTF